MQAKLSKEIEALITKAKPEEQRQLLAALPRLLKIKATDLTWLKFSEPSFKFWDNTDDKVYDNL